MSQSITLKMRGVRESKKGGVATIVNLQSQSGAYIGAVWVW